MPNAAFEAAVRLLSRREHSKKQLCFKLKQRGFSTAAIDDALAHCETHNLQSEARFAEMLCRGRIHRGYGPRVIRQLLKQEGIAHDVMEAALAEADEATDWVAEVARVFHKKYEIKSDIKTNASAAVRHKQWQFLSYRGFTESSIKQFFEQNFKSRYHHEQEFNQ